MNLSLLSYKDISANVDSARKDGKVSLAVLPVGCVEQHGPFLPTETDSLVANEFALDFCRTLNTQAFFAYSFPVVHYSPIRSGMNYSGTVSIDEEVFRKYLSGVCASILVSPFDALLMICGHGPAEPSMKEIGFRLTNSQFVESKKPVRPVFVISMFEVNSILFDKTGEKPGKHADWREFLMLYRILGDKYFDSEKLTRMKAFAAGNDFPVEVSSILGVPLEYRSTKGVLGSPLPSNENNFKLLADKMWGFQLEYFLAKIHSELKSFLEEWG